MTPTPCKRGTPNKNFSHRFVFFAISAVELLRSETGRMPVPRGRNKKAPDGSGTWMKTNLLIYGDGTTILPCGTRPNWLKASVVSSGETRPNSRVKSCQIDISAHAGFSRPTQKGQQMGTFRLPGSPAYENNQACKRLFL